MLGHVSSSTDGLRGFRLSWEEPRCDGTEGVVKPGRAAGALVARVCLDSNEPSERRSRGKRSRDLDPQRGDGVRRRSPLATSSAHSALNKLIPGRVANCGKCDSVSSKRVEHASTTILSAKQSVNHGETEVQAPTLLHGPSGRAASARIQLRFRRVEQKRKEMKRCKKSGTEHAEKTDG